MIRPILIVSGDFVGSGGALCLTVGDGNGASLTSYTSVSLSDCNMANNVVAGMILFDFGHAFDDASTWLPVNARAVVCKGGECIRLLVQFLIAMTIMYAKNDWRKRGSQAA